MTDFPTNPGAEEKLDDAASLPEDSSVFDLNERDRTPTDPPGEPMLLHTSPSSFPLDSAGDSLGPLPMKEAPPFGVIEGANTAPSVVDPGEDARKPTRQVPAMTGRMPAGKGPDPTVEGIPVIAANGKDGSDFLSGSLPDLPEDAKPHVRVHIDPWGRGPDLLPGDLYVLSDMGTKPDWSVPLLGEDYRAHLSDFRDMVRNDGGAWLDMDPLHPEFNTVRDLLLDLLKNAEVTDGKPTLRNARWVIGVPDHLDLRTADPGDLFLVPPQAADHLSENVTVHEPLSLTGMLRYLYQQRQEGRIHPEQADRLKSWFRNACDSGGAWGIKPAQPEPEEAATPKVTPDADSEITDLTTMARIEEPEEPPTPPRFDWNEPKRIVMGLGARAGTVLVAAVLLALVVITVAWVASGTYGQIRSAWVDARVLQVEQQATKADREAKAEARKVKALEAKAKATEAALDAEKKLRLIERERLKAEADHRTSVNAQVSGLPPAMAVQAAPPVVVPTTPTVVAPAPMPVSDPPSTSPPTSTLSINPWRFSEDHWQP